MFFFHTVDTNLLWYHKFCGGKLFQHRLRFYGIHKSFQKEHSPIWFQKCFKYVTFQYFTHEKSFEKFFSQKMLKMLNWPIHQVFKVKIFDAEELNFITQFSKDDKNYEPQAHNNLEKNFF